MVIDTNGLNKAINGVEVNGQDPLFALVYQELRRIAKQCMSGQAGNTLQPTALVSEVWLKLFQDQPGKQFDSRGHFFVSVSNAMRQILIDSARARNSAKRGGRFQKNEIPLEVLGILPNDAQLIELDEALTALEKVAPVRAQLVKLRYFSGLTIEESAAVLEISTATANRYWKFARVWLKRQMLIGS